MARISEKKYRVGIIGYGGFGHFLNHSWSSLNRIEIRAVSDKNPAIKPPVDSSFYRDWETLLQDPLIDIVAIATPPSSHVKIACEAMAQGKNVLIEKPIALSLKGAKKIILASKNSGKIAGVNYMLRFNPLVAHCSNWCNSQIFGQLGRASIENYAQDEGLAPEHWFWDRKVSGGVLVEHAVHFFDLVNYLVPSRIKKVKGCTVFRNAKMEDRVMASVQYTNGLIASHFHSFSRPGFFEQTSIRFIFDLAQVELSGWIPMSGKIQCLLNAENENVLSKLPGFQLIKKERIESLADISRPTGWGMGPIETCKGDGPNKKVIISGGRKYSADFLISGTFALNGVKSEIYADCLRNLLLDFIAAIDDPEHERKVTLADGYKSLRIALKAKSSAKKKD
ncbi:Gfo/Idh/MocA family protein [Candidatus Riflebacteria bacterium]